METHYELLKVAEDADKITIKKAFYRLAKQHHPDLSKKHDLFIKILNAYETLIDDGKRCRYDSALVRSRRMVLPKSRIHYALSLRDVAASKYPFWGSGVHKPVSGRFAQKEMWLMEERALRAKQRALLAKERVWSVKGYKGFDVSVSLTEPELRAGSTVHVDVPARVVCPLCHGDRVPCTLCSGKGQIMRAVEVPVDIPGHMDDGYVFSVPLRKLKQKEFAFFKIKCLLVKIHVVQE
jgi:DnaJ-class molecular chaperone